MASDPAAAAGGGNFAGQVNVRVVVVGEAGTGKSSLIVTVATESFPENVPHVLPPTRLPSDYYPDRVPITIIDTSSRYVRTMYHLSSSSSSLLVVQMLFCSRPEHKAKLIADCKAADVIVLTYACDRPSTLDRLSTYWLPELRRLEVKVPVLVVGCKLDLRDDPQQVSLDQVMAPIMQQFREIETCIECSAVRQIQFVDLPGVLTSSLLTILMQLNALVCANMYVYLYNPITYCTYTSSCKYNFGTLVQEVFYYAQKAVLHPTAPLFDQETQSLKPRCTRALKRIFILCDNDRDGALSDAELNNFQVRCFNAPLQPSEIVGVKRVVQEKIPEGVNDRGLTLTGFLFLHALFIERGRLETTWSVLRKFGYDNDLKLKDELLPTTFKLASDQTVELRDEALDFLKDIFHIFDIDSACGLRAITGSGSAIVPSEVLAMSTRRQKALMENKEDEDLEPLVLDMWCNKDACNRITTTINCGRKKVGKKAWASHAIVDAVYPWSESPYKDSAEKNVLGGLSLDGFISELRWLPRREADLNPTAFVERGDLGGNQSQPMCCLLLLEPSLDRAVVRLGILVSDASSNSGGCVAEPGDTSKFVTGLGNASKLVIRPERHIRACHRAWATLPGLRDGFGLVAPQWALMTLQDPKASLANLIYIGYTGDPASVFHVTRKRRLDRKKQRTQRNVFQCFVFGPKNAGKTTLLNSFIGRCRTFSEKYAPTTSYRFATNVVDLHNGTKKILVMREIPEQEVKNLLSNKESLAACDIAVFIYDSFNEESWKRTKELLEQVAHHGENTGFEVPCLIISAKDDLDAYTLNIQDSTRVTLEMGIESPIPISMKLRDHNDVFYRIVSAAQQPHLSIPETEAGKSRKQYRRFINQSLVFISVGAAVAVAGLAAYRIYAARKNTSG
ncbi:hypothetical protein ZIOFF_001547 [Zingiber officinale]|uniref:Miro domain-containing protein n=1 Tax=Zingiber officinale TaxID=94328 RepID=A0A8J5LS72_ZINOF|nr:hypothetical protein ZIOFF_001547 [Zingiber officinale]